MATYYRWRQRAISYSSVLDGDVQSMGDLESTGVYTINYSTGVQITENGTYDFSDASYYDMQKQLYMSFASYLAKEKYPTEMWYITAYATLQPDGTAQNAYAFRKYHIETSISPTSNYVYSTSASDYPNGGVSGDYYYDQRTTITSPTAPTDLQYPNPITTPTVTVSWDAAVSNVPGVSIDHYSVSCDFDGDGTYEKVLNVGNTLSAQISIPVGTETFSAVIHAYDTNNKFTMGAFGPRVPVYFSPTLTVPSIAMQNQPITVNWTAIDGATSYTLQRKANTDADWVQVYSGPNLTFTETAGAWESVQYRVQATFSAGTGSWATSESIPVMSASALVISGSDGDLGTLVNDVPYTISTDTGNPISVRTTVNGAVIFAGEVESGAAKAIPVLDLVNGEGTIVIEASVETSSGTVSAARAWTYDKDLITFPNGGSPAQMTKEGKIVFPKTLAECVRLPGGRTLDKVMGFPCQIFVGSYTGTGTYGSANPNEVTIPFKPQIVFVSNGSVGTTIPMIRPLEKAKSSAALTVAWTDDGVSWSATSAANQMNAKGTDYIVVAFG